MPQHHPMTKETSGEQRITITQMGTVAYQHLVPGERGVVLAALPDVAYVRTASAEILWLAWDGTPMHRRCARVGTPLAGLKAGAAFKVDERGLRIGPRALLETAASLWQPCPINNGEVVPLAELPGRARALASILDCAQAPGLGQLIPQIVHSDSEPVTTTDDPVLQRARPLALDAAAAFRKGDGERAVLCVDALVGFGAGLTPSGDDFLGGLMFGANALRTAYPNSYFFDLAVPAETYRSRTHPISWALLDDHTKGHAIAPLHVIVNGILEGASMADIRPAVQQLVRVGHSTGWDILAGLFAGLLMVDSRSGLCG
jgi:hypothetical protein